MTSSKSIIGNIIFCEDDEDDRFLFKDVLKDHEPKLQVEFVSDGTRLMKMLNHYVPDLLFLDLDMPFKNGLECLVEIRKSEVLKNLPVIVFSSTVRPVNIQTAYDMGAHLFLIKSSTFSEYASSIKAVLELDWKNPKAVRNEYCYNGKYEPFTIKQR